LNFTLISEFTENLKVFNQYFYRGIPDGNLVRQITQWPLKQASVDAHYQTGLCSLTRPLTHCSVPCYGIKNRP
jgi:hypothetical protein